MPSVTPSACVFGSAPYAVAAPEKILDCVRSWQWTSSPITTSQVELSYAMSGRPYENALGICLWKSVTCWNWCATFRSEEHTSELQSLMRISYAVFCLKKKTKTNITTTCCHYYNVQTHIHL